MARSIVLLLALVACTNDTNLSRADWEGANLRITEPVSAAFLPIEEEHTFRVEITDPEGNVLPTDELEITWTASADAEWLQSGDEFIDDALAVGLQDVTAEVTLPNGDRLAHTVGGLLVQSRYAGTYSGLFSTNIAFQEYAAGCGGAVTLVVDPYGEVAGGNATCLVSLMGFEVEAAYVFDLANSSGQISGTAAIDLFGFTGIEFPASGQLEPESGALTLEFGGDEATSMFIGIEGSVDAARVSRDAGLTVE